MLNSRKYERLRKNELQSEDATVSKPLHSRESKSSQIVDPKVDESKLTQGADALFEPTFKGEQNKENEVSEVINSMQKLQSSGSLESIWDDHVCICRDFSFFLPNTLGLNDFFWGGGYIYHFHKDTRKAAFFHKLPIYYTLCNYNIASFLSRSSI